MAAISSRHGRSDARKPRGRGLGSRFKIAHPFLCRRSVQPFEIPVVGVLHHARRLEQESDAVHAVDLAAPDRRLPLQVRIDMRARRVQRRDGALRLIAKALEQIGRGEVGAGAELLFGGDAERREARLQPGRLPPDLRADNSRAGGWCGRRSAWKARRRA
jgi:hypothetical protein